jgi:signal transduction histidine kinase
MKKIKLQYRKEAVLIIIMLMLLLFFAYWQIIDHLRHKHELDQSVYSLRKDINAALVGILNSQPRFGQIVLEKPVTAKLKSYMKNSHNGKLQAVALFNSKGKLLINTSNLPDKEQLWFRKKYGKNYLKVRILYAHIAAESGVSGGNPVIGTKKTVMSMINLISEEQQAHNGNMPPDGKQLSEKIKELLSDDYFKEKTVYEIVYLLDVSFRNKSISTDLMLRLASLLFASLAFAVFCYSLLNLNRNFKLQILLAKEQEKNEYLQEMHLVAAGLAHDIKNPLNIVRGATQSIAQVSGSDKIKEKALLIVDEVDRINSRLNKFLSYSNLTPLKIHSLKLQEIVNEIVSILQFDCEDRNIKIELSVPDIKVMADKQALSQIIFNLMHNALNAVNENGIIYLKAYEADDGFLIIEVADDGPGIPENIKNDIFKPYVTGSSDGTGLGLAIVKHLCFRLSWRIKYEDRKNCGAVFKIEGIRKDEKA